MTTLTSREAIAWRRGFFRVWVLLSALWIVGAVWVESLPQSGPPKFDETSPFLKLGPDGKFYSSLAECQAAAKLDPRVDLANCIEYFEAERFEPVRRAARAAGWIAVPPLLLLLIGAAVGWALRGFRRTAS
jgi:hypothetical protein